LTLLVNPLIAYINRIIRGMNLNKRADTPIANIIIIIGLDKFGKLHNKFGISQSGTDTIVAKLTMFLISEKNLLTVYVQY
jgi:hypothetical protein